MSDFGTELGNSGMSAMSKVSEAILKIMGKIFELLIEKTSTEHRLKKAEYKKVKQTIEAEALKQKYEGMAGYVNYKKLTKTGTELTSCEVNVDKKGMKKLAEYCKREGILITGLQDVRDKEILGKRSYIVMCKEADLPRINKILELMVEEQRINNLQKMVSLCSEEEKKAKSELSELKKIENPTEEERKRIAELEGKARKAEKEKNKYENLVDDIRFGYANELNVAQSEVIIDNVLDNKKNVGINFDTALNRYTGGEMNLGKKTFVVDTQNVDNVIICDSNTDKYNGEEYIKTTYDVYNGENKVYSTDDGRFDGRNKDYWKNVKKEMKEKGGFSDTVLVFQSPKEYEAYRTEVQKQNKEELNFNVGETGRNYDEIISQLNDKLKECGAEYKDGKATIETGELMKLHEGMDEREQANVAETTVIVNQIDNYRKLKKLETELNIANAELMTSKRGSPEYIKANGNYEAIKRQVEKELETEKELVKQRMSVNVVQSLQEVKEAKERSAEQNNELGEQEIGERTMESYQAKIEKRKEADTEKSTPAPNGNRISNNKNNHEH